VRIVVTGSLAYDHILNFPEKFADHIMPDKLHVLSVSFLADNLAKNFGGTAGNIAYTLGLLGNKVAIVGSLGKDAPDYLQHLKKAGVTTDGVRVDRKDYTANFFVITDRADCQIAGFYPGAMRHDTRLDLSADTDFLVVSPTLPDAMDRYARQAQKHRMRYLYAPTQQIPRLTKDQLMRGIKGAEILVGNDYELALLEKKVGKTKKQLEKMVRALIVTLGDKGSEIHSRGKKYRIPIAQPKKLVDPTGAGDAFIAGFLTGYLCGKGIRASGRMGALAGTYALEQYGTQNHRFTGQSFQKRLQNSFSL
jgi:adenosine kinase